MSIQSQALCNSFFQVETIEIEVRVIPRASRNELVRNEEGIYIARVTAAPIKGEANRAVIRLLAEHFCIAPSRIRLLSGSTARRKRFRLG